MDTFIDYVCKIYIFCRRVISVQNKAPGLPIQSHCVIQLYLLPTAITRNASHIVTGDKIVPV